MTVFQRYTEIKQAIILSMLLSKTPYNKGRIWICFVPIHSYEQLLPDETVLTKALTVKLPCASLALRMMKRHLIHADKD